MTTALSHPYDVVLSLASDVQALSLQTAAQLHYTEMVVSSI